MYSPGSVALRAFHASLGNMTGFQVTDGSADDSGMDISIWLIPIGAMAFKFFSLY
jgi:hypothetical protein